MRIFAKTIAGVAVSLMALLASPSAAQADVTLPPTTGKQSCVEMFEYHCVKAAVVNQIVAEQSEA